MQICAHPTDAESRNNLLVLIHQLIGSGAGYGLLDISAKAREVEARPLDAGAGPHAAQSAHRALVQTLRQAQLLRASQKRQ